MHVRPSLTVTRVALAIAVVLMTGSAWHAATVSVRLRSPNPDQSIRGTLIAQASEASLPAVRTEVVIPSDTSIELPEAPAWTLSLQGDGLWAAPQTVLGDRADLVTMEAFAAGIVEFRPKTPPRGGSRSFRATFQALDKKIAGTSDCTMLGEQVSCPVVALPVDLRLGTDGLVPHYVWSVSVAPGAIRNLGEVTFGAGASLSGYVRSPSAGEPILGRAVIQLVPESRAKLSEADEDRAALVALQARPAKNGFFQFRGVRPGAYGVTAISGKQRSPTVNVTIHPEVEAQLKEPLLLQEPFNLNVTVLPPVDPWNKPWVVTLERHSGTPNHLDPVTSGAASVVGSWSASGLTAGTYAVTVGRAGPGTWLHREIELDRETQLVLSMDLVKVVGKVLSGERPLTGAWVWFGGEHGGVPVLVRENGEFRVQLPRQDNDVWKRVEVVGEQPAVRAVLKDVVVKPVAGGDIARVTLQFSDRAIHGQVVDARGEPVTEPVAINMTRPDSDEFLQIATGDHGEFSLHGVETGTIHLTAVARGAESAPLAVTVEKEQKEPPFVELRLQDKQTVQGVIRSRFGAIAGARITAIPDRRLANVSYTLTSDLEGKFQAHLNAASAGLTLSVAAPGYGFRFFRTGIPADPLIVDVDHVGGRLVLEFPLSDAVETSEIVPVFFHGGSYDALPSLAFRAGESVAHTQDLTRITIPLAEPGEYAVCWKSRGEWLALLEGKSVPKPEGRCTAGYLAPFSELRLRITQ